MLINKKAISEESCIKYLGVLIDCHLNWKQHIQHISKKVSRSIGIMYKLRNFLDSNLLKNIYYSLIYSYLVYGIESWGSACETELNKILVLQKKAVRMMTFNDNYPVIPGPLTPSGPLFKKLGLLKIDDIFNLFVSKFILSCLLRISPSIFHLWFILSIDVHNHNSRLNSRISVDNYFEVGTPENINTLHTNGSRLENYGRKLLKVSGQVIWNSLPKEIRCSPSIISLKYHLKNYLVNLY